MARTAPHDAAFGRLITDPRSALTRAVCRTQVVYGLVFLATSALRLTLIFSLPVDTAVWVSGVMLPAGIVLATIASVPFTGRAASVVDAEAASDHAAGTS